MNILSWVGLLFLFSYAAVNADDLSPRASLLQMEEFNGEYENHEVHIKSVSSFVGPNQCLFLTTNTILRQPLDDELPSTRVKLWDTLEISIDLADSKLNSVLEGECPVKVNGCRRSLLLGFAKGSVKYVVGGLDYPELGDAEKRSSNSFTLNFRDEAAALRARESLLEISSECYLGE